MLKLDAVVPVVLIAAALLMTLEPTILGVTITERQIVLAFFGFLGIDTLIERTGRLRRIERQLKTLTENASGSQNAGQVIRARSSFRSGVDPVLRRGKIVQNLELLWREFAQLAPDVRARVRLMVSGGGAGRTGTAPTRLRTPPSTPPGLARRPGAAQAGHLTLEPARALTPSDSPDLATRSMRSTRAR